jgi:hypothetical protein
VVLLVVVHTDRCEHGARVRIAGRDGEDLACEIFCLTTTSEIAQDASESDPGHRIALWRLAELARLAVGQECGPVVTAHAERGAERAQRLDRLPVADEESARLDLEVDLALG